jgi:hypothetical protein
MNEGNKTPIREEDLPVNNEEDEGGELKKVRVTADGKPANCFILEAPFRSTRIVIEFDDAGDTNKKTFATKKFLL